MGVCLSVWRWGCVPGGASRGRACARREALGRKAFALRAGEERVFASNARSDPAPRAPGGWVVLGVGPLWRRALVYCAGSVGCRFVWGCVCRSGDGVVCLVGLRGAGPALAGRLWGGKLSRCALGRKGCSPPMLAPTRPRGRPSWRCLLTAGFQRQALSGNAAPATRPGRPVLLRGRGLRG